MSRAARESLRHSDLVEMLAAELLDENGFPDTDRPLYDWVKRHMFSGNVEALMAVLHAPKEYGDDPKRVRVESTEGSR